MSASSSAMGSDSVHAERAGTAGPPHHAAAHRVNLARNLRGLMGKRNAICRLQRISPTVQILEHRSKDSLRLGFGGVSTCQSTLCPLCYPAIARERALKVQSALDNWGRPRVVFATFTLKHNRRMPLALTHRVLTRAKGLLWSGRKGQRLAVKCGGKPHQIHAHDKTWSEEEGFHPHLHSLLFFPRAPSDEVASLLRERWRECLALAVDQMVSSLHKATEELVTGLRKGLRIGREKTLERLHGVFSKRLVGDDVREALTRLLPQMRFLQAVANINEHGVKAEVCSKGSVANYLSKLGLEIAHMSSKKGKTDSRGITHYSVWEMAALCGEKERGRHSKRAQRARAAWAELYSATKGQQTLSFSRGAISALLGDDHEAHREPEDDDNETLADEESRVIGAVSGDVWDRLKSRFRGHELHSVLYEAHSLGVLREMPWLEKPPGISFCWIAQREKRSKPPLSELDRSIRLRKALEGAASPPLVDVANAKYRRLSREKRLDSLVAMRAQLRAIGALRKPLGLDTT